MNPASEGVRQRKDVDDPKPVVNGASSTKRWEHPSGPPKHSEPVQYLLMLAFTLYFSSACIALHIFQIVGCPLYFISKDYFYAWMAMSKQLFTLIGNTIVQWFSPVKIRISSDAGLADQFSLTKDGRLVTSFPERLVMIANHQLYTEWLYLWWIGYTSGQHGHIFIVIKESVKYIPILGHGMQLFSFIFLARNWTRDRPRLHHRLQKLNAQHAGPLSGRPGALDPMWLLIFPEGTNLSKNGRRSSASWAEKNGMADLKHQLLPRSTGLLYCLTELRKTVDWVYDCTIAYEGIPHGDYGQDVYTLKGSFFQGRAPRSVNMYWRRFAISSIPLDDPKAFERWVLERWIEKDALIEQYQQTGRFPALPEQEPKAEASTRRGQWIETEVKQSHPLEFLLAYLPFVVLWIAVSFLRSLWRAVF
ncbi:MAG: hypothetical protein M1828_004001 [Chrysothrix sp. TS-e1954]|nr:MAG: hypothetical protein M1828_004001 [Chrysothrix sp. TS-e1954]